MTSSGGPCYVCGAIKSFPDGICFFVKKKKNGDVLISVVPFKVVFVGLHTSNMMVMPLFLAFNEVRCVCVKLNKRIS